MEKNDFILMGGMPRGGSTWLYRNLMLHPFANVSALKETNFYTINFHRGLEWYYSLYDSTPKKDSFNFDISPFYFLCPDFIKNIKSINAKPKVILVLREPNEWIQSFYYQTKSYNYNMTSFEEFIDHHPLKFDGKTVHLNLKNFNYVDRVNEYIDTFSDNLLLINFEVIKNDPCKALKSIEKFANIPSFLNPKTAITSKINASTTQFSLLNKISTQGWARSISNIAPLAIVRYFQKIIYKEDLKKIQGVDNSQNHSEKKSKYILLKGKEDYIDTLFEPKVYKTNFFSQSDIVHA